MYTSDKKILQLIEVLKSNGTINFNAEFAREIGIMKQNLYKIQIGEKHFTPSHIENIIKTYKINANWLFGVSDNIFLAAKINTQTRTQKEVKS